MTSAEVDGDARTEGGAARIEQHHGSAQKLHGMRPPAENALSVRVMDVDRSAAVLGSSQDPALLDRRLAAARGIEIVSRSSGGGAVLLVPKEHLWVDFWVPRGHERFEDDVVRASFWAGELWASVAEQVLERPASVHRGGLIRGEHGATICFAGSGPGEVSVDGRKLVGISQRRSRDWIRIQTLAHQKWSPAVLVGLLGLDPRPSAEMTAELTGLVCTAPRGQLLAALVEGLKA